MSLKVPTAFLDLRHCLKVNSCRYLTRQNKFNVTGSTTTSESRRFIHGAYAPVVLQHATIPSPVPWLETAELKDGFIRISSTRSYATATRLEEPGTSRAQAVLAAFPIPEKMAPDEEVELLDKGEARFSITERAAEKLSNISTSENGLNISLRVAVESGGCHGYQYKFELTSEQAPDDYRFVHPKHRNAALLVDAVSLGLLKGSTLDYATELIGSSFRIIDNPQSKSAGCGCGISWEAKF